MALHKFPERQTAGLRIFRSTQADKRNPNDAHLNFSADLHKFGIFN